MPAASPMSMRDQTRADFPYRHQVATRWADNDVYGHVNNVRYLAYFDTAINAWLIAQDQLDIADGPAIGLCVESHCEYHAPIAFPEVVEIGLRVGSIGRSSVRYELAVFALGSPTPAAHGWFVHVFVGRHERRATPIPDSLRDRLSTLVVPR